jgi:hypothetical protein
LLHPIAERIVFRKVELVGQRREAASRNTRHRAAGKFSGDVNRNKKAGMNDDNFIRLGLFDVSLCWKSSHLPLVDLPWATFGTNLHYRLTMTQAIPVLRTIFARMHTFPFGHMRRSG